MQQRPCKPLWVEKLQRILPCFSSAQCDVFSQYCIVALEQCGHNSGCILNLESDPAKKFKLEWKKEFPRAGYKEPKKITEKAAEAISFLLVKELTEYTVVEEASIGTGIDYWLGYNETHELYDPFNFLQARIEVSGIAIEKNTNTIKRRVAIKKAQTENTDKTNLPAYISVIELSTPKAHFEKK